MSILTKYLEKIGVKGQEDLSKEEQDVFERYKRILSGETITVDTIKEFCQSQVKIIESQCDGKTPLSNLQQASLHIYLNILKAIDAPQSERESLERHLIQIINS